MGCEHGQARQDNQCVEDVFARAHLPPPQELRKSKMFPATLTVELRAATMRPSTVMTTETGKGLKLFWEKSAKIVAQERKARR
jgi:hypothetical protein